MSYDPLFVPNGSHDMTFQILANEGPKGLYKGVVPRLGRVIPGQGIIFMSYERIQTFVQSLVEKPAKA